MKDSSFETETKDLPRDTKMNRMQGAYSILKCFKIDNIDSSTSAETVHTFEQFNPVNAKIFNFFPLLMQS